MEVKYGVILRNFLTTEVELLQIHCFDIEDVKFSDADVSSAVVFFKKARPKASHQTRFTFGTNIREPTHSLQIPINALRNATKWALNKEMTINDFYENNIESQSGTKIGDFFNVKRGLATGANNFFILDKEKAKKLGIPKKFLVPILPSSRELGDIEIIEADDLGIPLRNPRFLLNCSLPKDILKNKHLQLYKYILKGEEMELHLRFLTRNRTPWYKQETRTPAPIICRYMGRKSKNSRIAKFYRNKSKAIVTNAYLMLYPRKNVLSRLKDPDIFFDEVFHALKKIDQEKILLHGRSYGGGLYKIEPKELKNVLVPLLPDIQLTGSNIAS